MAVARREVAPAEALGEGTELGQGGKSSACPGSWGRGGLGGVLGISCLEKQTGECSNSRSHVCQGQSLGDQADMVTCGIMG